MSQYRELSDDDLIHLYCNELILLDVGAKVCEQDLDKLFEEAILRDLDVAKIASQAIRSVSAIERYIANNIDRNIEANAEFLGTGLTDEHHTCKECEEDYVVKVIDMGVPIIDDQSDPALHVVERFVRNIGKYDYAIVRGDSMINANIHDGNVLIVDTTKEPKNYDLITATIDGKKFIKRFHKEDGNVKLLSENDDYADIVITEFMDFRVCGVVRAKVDMNI